MENKLAEISLKGGRYLEAEKMYSDDLSKDPNFYSYFGLGVCKINLLLDSGRSVDETVFCFQESINLSDEVNKNDVKIQIFGILKTILEQYSSLYIQLEEQKKKEATQAAIGAALTVGAAMVGSSHKSNAFTQIASLAVAGGGAGVALDGLSNLGKIPDIQNYIIKIGEELILKFQYIGHDDYDSLSQIFSREKLIEPSKRQKKSINIEDRTEKKEKMILVLLLFLLIHRLYLGKWKSGLLFLFSLGGYGIWAAVDLYKILFKEFNPEW